MTLNEQIAHYSKLPLPFQPELGQCNADGGRACGARARQPDQAFQAAGGKDRRQRGGGTLRIGRAGAGGRSVVRAHDRISLRRRRVKTNGIDGTIIGCDHGPGTAVRFPVAAETKRMGADQFPPHRTPRTAASGSARPAVADAAAFPAPGSRGRPHAVWWVSRRRDAIFWRAVRLRRMSVAGLEN